VSRIRPNWALQQESNYWGLVTRLGSKREAARALINAVPSLSHLCEDSVMRAFRVHGGEEGGETGPTPVVAPPPAAAPSLPPIIFDGIDVPYEDCHVWCDLHVPMHNNRLVDLSIERAHFQGIRTLCVVGDLMDMAWASRFQNWAKHGPREVEEEFAEARKVLNRARQHFNTILICAGNHDGTRLKQMSHGALTMDHLLTLVLGDDAWKDDGSIQITDQRYMVLRGSPWGDWRLTHPDKARAVPLSLAQSISQTKHCNVLTAHQHYLGVAFDRFGKHIIADGGYMSREDLMEYKQELDTPHSSWAPGYIELIGGLPQVVAIPGQRELFAKYGGRNA